MIMTANGIIIRTGLEQIREIGRNTQGVRLIKLEDNDKVVAVERVIKEDESESSGFETETQAEPEAEESQETGDNEVQDEE
jgi:DNA gyrase subunit A